MPPPTRRRPDPQTDYEDPIDRLYRRSSEPRERKKKPPKRPNPVATVAYVLGLIGLVPCLGALLGPIAVLLGILGMVHARNPEVGGKEQAKSGLWFGLLAVVINYGVPLILYGIIMMLR
jgi:hypothetical protein